MQIISSCLRILRLPASSTYSFFLPDQPCDSRLNPLHPGGPAMEALKWLNSLMLIGPEIEQIEVYNRLLYIHWWELGDLEEQEAEGGAFLKC